MDSLVSWRCITPKTEADLILLVQATTSQIHLTVYVPADAVGLDEGGTRKHGETTIVASAVYTVPQ